MSNSKVRNEDDFFRDQNAKTSQMYCIGDILDPAIASNHPQLRSYQNYFDVIYTGSVLHLFDLNEQNIFIQNVKKFLKPGGHFIGRTTALLESSSVERSSFPAGTEKEIFLHNTASLLHLLNSLFGNHSSIVKLIARGEKGDFSQEIPNCVERQRRVVVMFSSSLAPISE